MAARRHGRDLMLSLMYLARAALSEMQCTALFDDLVLLLRELGLGDMLDELCPGQS